MLLTSAQLQAVKTNILTNSDLNSQPNDSDGAVEIAKLYNLNASPSFTVWKTNVSVKEIGDKINGNDLAGLSTLNNTRLQTAVTLAVSGFNPSLADRRFFFDDIFSGAGGVTTRANLLALWKRLGSRIEKLFATGTGSDASPATIVFEGPVSFQDIEKARNLP